MKILFKNANMIDKNGESVKGVDICTDGEYILSVASPANTEVDRKIDAENMLIIPGLYNCHTHLPMTVFKGYAEDMPLDKWLFDKIFPAEAKLNDIIVYYGAMSGIAEQIKNGVISCSDMYGFSENILRSADESGIKLNLSNGTTSWDENENPKDNKNFTEAKELYRNYHNSSNGRIKIDMSMHAEYTSHANIIRAVSEFSHANGLVNHVHISETKKEHDECIGRHNMTPTEWFNSLGFFDSPSPKIAAHCVHITENDMDIMAEKGVTAAHCPSSNLKLASGIAKIPEMLNKGVNIAMGTDGSASNNNLDILKEMYIASVLQKGITGDPTVMPAKDMLKLATVNAAAAQGRGDCGSIEPGKKADLAALDLNSIEAVPVYDYSSALLYSITGRNVIMTMCDGKILYEKGEFKTIDIEKVKYMINKLSGLYK
ncbi:MAG: amidohydrolase [Oscillospiraceae bacterium]|nr:amidohydrolase [Oscillospiraceae bacterium]